MTDTMPSKLKLITTPIGEEVRHRSELDTPVLENETASGALYSAQSEHNGFASTPLSVDDSLLDVM